MAAGLPVLAACGVPILSGAHLSTGWDVGRSASFAWRDEVDRTVGDARLRDNRFFHDRLHEAVEWELSLRGIRYDASAPDLLIHHHLSLAEHVLEREVMDEAGFATTETEIYEGGSVVVHLVDARNGEDVWVGWAQANIEPALTGPESMRRWVYNMVGHMFEDWPLPPRAEGS